jgi:transposase
MLSDFSEDLGEEICQGLYSAFCERGRQSPQRPKLKIPANIIMHLLPLYSPELNPQETLWDEIRENDSRTTPSNPFP